MNIPAITNLKSLFKKAVGSSTVSDLNCFIEKLQGIKKFDYLDAAEVELAERASNLRNAVFANAVDPQMEAEVFALVAEASRRKLGLNPFDTQLIAGLAMAKGFIAKLPTGEGKTLAAVFPASLHAFSGRGSHILTFNDYLARRDAGWMGPVYRALGLTVGCIQEGMSFEQKRAAYQCDVTYASAKEVGFDFLRDQIAYERNDLVHRPFQFALIDEADSILVDEARIPLVISGAEDRASWDAARLASLAKQLTLGRDYETDDEHRNVFLTECGAERFESLAGCGSLYSGENQSLLESLYCALHAEALLRRDIDYIVRSGKIEIVDEYTGRTVEKRHWPDGLQAAVEAKEGLQKKTQGRVLGSITLQHFFRLYPMMSGMTATAVPAADELCEFYGLKTVVIPPHIHSIRVDHPDIVFTHKNAKINAIVKEIQTVASTGRPILVGTGSIKESEELGAKLRAAGIKHSILNAKNDELEAEIIAKAGMLDAVTISTNMAGRGVDIKLGGNSENERIAVAALGGLYVLGTNRHESMRIDQQLRGRAGRQGDPGMTRFFISLEDDLFAHYGLTKLFFNRHKLHYQENEIRNKWIAAEIAHYQRIIEGQNLGIRRNLNRYSSIVEAQRRIVHSIREDIVEDQIMSGSANNESFLSLDRFEDATIWKEGVKKFDLEKMQFFRRRSALYHIDRLWSDYLAWIQDTRDRIHLVTLGAREPIDEFLRWSTSEFNKMSGLIEESILNDIASILGEEDAIDYALEKLKAPSSTWTYLVNDSQFGSSLEIMKGSNIGFSAVAAITGPLFILAALYERSRRKRR